MRILVLGADGYLGWPTAMHFSAKGHDVGLVDNLSKRYLEVRIGTQPLYPVPVLHERVRRWHTVSGKRLALYVGDLTNHRFIYHALEEFAPDVIVHYAEQPSAPYSMIGREEAAFTQMNNVLGTLNLLFAMKRFCPAAHLVKLGTMGEYGTPNIDIEEGFLEVTHNGRTDVLPFPKQPGSFYHLSKVHDSHNIMFACRVWGLRCTDLNQGVVYGISSNETELHQDLATSFHYDETFGTVLNRFCVEAVMGLPLTVYGRGGQTRGFLNIRDTLQCVDLTAGNPPAAGEFRVFNQLTETFSVNELADKVAAVASNAGFHVKVDHVANPRVEKEGHYYNVKHTHLADLGLRPNLLTEDVIADMLERVKRHKDRVLLETIQPKHRWKYESTSVLV
jgi:UDP-sulfoquinovose synthase